MKKKWNGNRNHPAKGSKIKVEPIKSVKDIKLIKMLLRDKPRDLALFTVGINTALRASDLVGIRVADVRHLSPGDDLELKERKTGNIRRLTLNGESVRAIRQLLEAKRPGDADYLFAGQRGQMTVQTVNRLVKSWCAAVNLKGNYGSHTLRKTWGYHQRVTFGQDLSVLTDCLGHSSQKITLSYLCIQADEVRSVYMNEL